jgi:tryptophan-rich sensory protein
MKFSTTTKIIVALGIPQIVGLAAAVISPVDTSWYPSLINSPLTPPGFVFGIVWPALYLLMGISAFLVWRKGWKKPGIRFALYIFGLQLAMNLLWSFLFFGLRNTGAALIDIVSLWFAILATILAFYKVSRPAAWLLIPYIIWVTFAAYLNHFIWTFN